jgi:heme/copper-type cytochrome/quinol oxidase subunit 3
MIRRLLYETLLFLLPFALYAVYLRLSKREEDAPRPKHPWTILFASGLALVAASFLIWGITEGAGEQGVYVPPHVENGRVVPGHVEPGAPK